MDASSLIKIAVPMGAMFLSSRLDQKDPLTILIVRVAYGVAVALLLLAMLRVRMLILAKRDKTAVPAPADDAAVAAASAAPAPKDVEEYDQQQLQAWLSSQVMGVLMPVGLHIYFGMLQMLIISTLLLPINAAEHPLVRVHLLGADIPRPFPAPKNAMADALKKLTAGGEDAAAATPAAAAAAAPDAAAGEMTAAARAEAFRKARAAVSAGATRRKAE